MLYALLLYMQLVYSDSYGCQQTETIVSIMFFDAAKICRETLQKKIKVQSKYKQCTFLVRKLFLQFKCTLSNKW